MVIEMSIVPIVEVLIDIGSPSPPTTLSNILPPTATTYQYLLFIRKMKA